MKQRKSPFVIAIGSVSGGGKTTVVTHLTEQLQKSKALYFDDYDFDGPDDILAWMDNGSDYDEWDLTPFIADLEKLLEEPLDYILLDFPFATRHSQTSKYIDFTVFIDTSLDIALARRMIRDYQDKPAEHILLQLKHYIDKGRPAYLEMLDRIKPDSDFRVDGSLPLSSIVDEIEQKVRHNENKQKQNNCQERQ